jgi:hypothetical protein
VVWLFPPLYAILALILISSVAELSSVVSLGISIAVAFSCISTATSYMYIVSLNPGEVLQNLDTGLYGTSSVGLPSRYMFGISGKTTANKPLNRLTRTGICRDWEFEGRDVKMQCVRNFPQQLNLLSLIQADTQDQNSSDYKKWIQVLSTKKMISDQNAWNTYTQAAAALLILSIFWVVATIALMFAVKSLYPLIIAILDMLDAILMLTAASLWTAAVVQAGQDYKAPRMFDTYGTINIGPGLWLLWAICIAKLCVIPAIALVLFLLIPGVCLIAWCKNFGNPDERRGDEWCCEAMFCLCCDE